MREEFLENDKPHDECGVFGVYSSTSRDLASTLYYGLYALQHRGQEAAGMAITTGNRIKYYKNIGLVSEVFASKLDQMPEGDIGLGHVLYDSRVKKGDNSVVNTQPIVCKGKMGFFSLAMNGKITNCEDLRSELIEEGCVFQTRLDIEVISALVNKYYDKNDVIGGIKNAMDKLEGSFAIVLITTTELFAIRDKYGMRPLCYGKFFDDYYVSSESCAIDASEAKFVRDIEAGEILQIDASGEKSVYLDGVNKHPCIFEFVYTARADSVIDGTSVYDARFNSGRMLARTFKEEVDIVAGVPDSALVAARGFAYESGIPYVDVLEKNRYVGRTFIQPSQNQRENSVRIKLNGHRANIQGKRIALVDDSLVRGTTSRKIVEMLKKLGAKEVHLILASPKVLHPCYTGIDIESYDQLLAANNTTQEMKKILGCDSLHFMKIEDLVKCCKSEHNKAFCSACFDKKYYGITEKGDK